jgi:hypothetical protein
MNDDKLFEAVQSLAQGLSQWDLLIIGGSMVLIVSTGYYRPLTRWMRMTYLLFLPSWAFLAVSVYRGFEVQGSYVAYLAAVRRNDTASFNDMASKMNLNVTAQILYLKIALVCIGLWLVTYVLWWILSDRITGGDAKC